VKDENLVDEKKTKLSDFLQPDEIIDKTVYVGDLDHKSYVFDNLEFSHEPIEKFKQEHILKKDGFKDEISRCYQVKEGKKYTYTDYYNDFINKHKRKREIPDFFKDIDFTQLKEGKRKIVRLQMISDTEFGVTNTFFTPGDLAVLFSKYNYRFDEKYKEAIINFEKYPEFLFELQGMARSKNWVVFPIPDMVFELINHPTPFSDEYIENFVGYDYTRDLKNMPALEELPLSLQDALYNFQLEGIRFGIRHHGRLLLGDEMGVGKTIQALGIA
jgi:SNF2 family DNA or RNA helicase